MKQKIVLAIALFSILSTGCSAKEESTYSHDGRIALENNMYDEAKKLLSSALEEDSSDEHSRAMYMQAVRMINVNKYEEIKNYEKAIKELEFIEDIKGGSSVIKNEASDKKKELTNLLEEQENAEQKRKQDAKNVSKQDRYKLQQNALKPERKKQETLELQRIEEKKEIENEEIEEEKEEEEEEEEVIVSPSNNEEVVVSPPNNIDRE